MTRFYTNKVIEMCQEGILEWETLARECLSFMSEDDVEDMATSSGLVDSQEEDEDDPWEEGRYAALNEADPNENPYSLIHEPDHYNAWIDGYESIREI